jgi:type VI secretion system secreted protein Hcp
MTSASVLSRTRTVVVALAVALAAILVASVAWQLANPRSGAITQASAAVGVRITMKVNGTVQGLFKGDDNAGPRAANQINVTAYQFELTVPRDIATGQASGKRVYKPMVITHVMGGSSPQFLRAAATNERLKSVVINFYRTDRFGRDVNYYRVTLTDAFLSDVKQYTGGTDVLEDDSFSFRQVEQQDLIAHTDFVDDIGSVA